MKIVGLVGSIRQNSYNRQVAEYMKERYKDRVEIQYANIKELPYFDEDIEEDPPTVVKEFKNSIANADAVLIVTPEYNHSVPGILKNAIDWLSRGQKVMIGKPVMIVGATTGMLGTVRCQIHLRQILAAPGVSAKVLPGNEVLIGFVQNKINEKGQLVDEPTIAFLDTVVENFKVFANDLNRQNK